MSRELSRAANGSLANRAPHSAKSAAANLGRMPGDARQRHIVGLARGEHGGAGSQYLQLRGAALQPAEQKRAVQVSKHKIETAIGTRIDAKASDPDSPTFKIITTASSAQERALSMLRPSPRSQTAHTASDPRGRFGAGFRLGRPGAQLNRHGQHDRPRRGVSRCLATSPRYRTETMPGVVGNETVVIDCCGAGRTTRPIATSPCNRPCRHEQGTREGSTVPLPRGAYRPVRFHTRHTTNPH